jgi:hypothetical protein
VEHQTVGVWPTAGSETQGDDTRRFLRELRQLRDCAGLEQVELAARAHYPHDYIRAAETGPALPDLPMLSAYVKGCGGTVDEWEERWRQLTNTPALPLHLIRSAGASGAATSGARTDSAFGVADLADPAAIMAALNRVAETIAAETSSPPRSARAPLPSRAPSSLASAEQPADAAWDKASIAAVARPAAAPGAATIAKPTVTALAGRRFSMTSRATIAALVALAICVIVAVLAVFT